MALCIYQIGGLLTGEVAFNFFTPVAFALVAVAFYMLFFALRSIIRDWRSGSSKCAECGGGCSESACASCSSVEGMVKRLDALE